MNQNFKQVFRKMNLDNDVRTMQPGDYRMLTNGSPIQPYSSSYANAVQDVVCSLLGNDLVTNSLPSGTNQVIGFLQDRKSNRAFYCVWNNTAAYNSIYQYKDGAITLVMRTALFPWAQTDFIDMDIVGDILIFTNGRSDIQKINVVKAIAGGTYTPLATELTLIKPPPRLPLTWALSYDVAKDSNYLTGNYFQFYYRYIYEDNDYSVFSPCSKTTNSWVIPNTAHSLVVDFVEAVNNIALAGAQTIDGHLTGVGDKVLLTAQTDKKENGLWVVAAGAWTRHASLPAAGTATSDLIIFISADSDNYNLNSGVYYFATVWKYVVGSSNTVGTDPLIFIQIDGPNKLTITEPEATPAIVIQREFAVRINGDNEFIVYRSEKKGAYSSTHTFYNDTYLFTVPDADTFVWNDSIPLKSAALKIFKNRPFLFNNTEGFDHSTTTKLTLSASAISPIPDEKFFNSAKSGGTYGVGVMFFDFARRHSGVKCDDTITIPDNRDDASSRASYKISVNTTPIAGDVPSWATHFSICITKCQNYATLLSSYTVDIYHYKKDASGDYVFNQGLASIDAIGSAIDISSLTRINEGYTFQAGDRIKIYDRGPASIPKIVDVQIISQDGRFIFTRVLSELYIVGSTAYKFEIYTPKKTQEEPFYETGFTFPIAAIGTTYLLEGDVENISVPRYLDGTHSATDPFSNQYDQAAPKWIQAMNAWQKNYTEWVTQTGRPMVKSDSRQINKYSYIRFGQQYIQNSNFLGINTFYALDEQALPIENGAGTRLAEAGEVLVAVHEIETEAVYVGQGFVKTDNGQNQFLTKTDNVIGDVRRYQGGYGSVNPASVVSREGKVYFVDRRNGCIVRRSQDGLTSISDYGVRGLMSTLCGIHDVLATSRIIAGWDPQYDCYCVSFIDTSGPSGYTYYFNEDKNAWVFRSTMLPEFWGLLNQDQFAFKSGAMWAQTIEGNYNKFFGVQYNRSLDIEFSPLRSLIHLWDAIEVDVENIYSTSGSNEDIVLLYHKNGDTLQTKINYADFRLRESDRVWRSAFFRWINDPNFSAPDAITKSKYGSVKRIRGQSAFVNIAYNGTDRNPMKSITIFYTPSMQSTP